MVCYLNQCVHLCEKSAFNDSVGCTCAQETATYLVKGQLHLEVLDGHILILFKWEQQLGNILLDKFLLSLLHYHTKRAQPKIISLTVLIMFGVWFEHKNQENHLNSFPFSFKCIMMSSVRRFYWSSKYNCWGRKGKCIPLAVWGWLVMWDFSIYFTQQSSPARSLCVSLSV